MTRIALLIAMLAAAAQPAAAQAYDPVEAAFVVLGPGGQGVVRVITRAAACPAVMVDGVARPMTVRVGPGTEPLRPTRSSLDNSKPSAFPVRTCDAPLPPGSRSAQVARHRLPVPRRPVRRIVVIGDTGCRLKASDSAWQACNDPAAYPFARIAAKAAQTRPDLVVHVGDYLYRENPCPADNAGCSGSPWGYGWDAWQADFFAPAAPLLAIAPWIVVRGNHENCARAGQGWWRLLDPRALLAGRDCNNQADDHTGDVSEAYAVPLGGKANIVVMDLSAAGTDALKTDDWRIAPFTQAARDLAALTKGEHFTFAADHYPLLGVAASKTGLEPGNAALQPIFTGIMPPSVDVLLAGHIHVWEQVDFAGRRPSQFVAGFSGTQEDIVPLPKVLPVVASPAPDAAVRQFNSIVDRFGFMALERTGSTSWRVVVYSVEGVPLERCRIRGRVSTCRPA
jgi:hypothetical protein